MHSPNGPPLMSPNGSIVSSPEDCEPLLSGSDVMTAAAAAFQNVQGLAQQGRSASVSLSPFADPARLGSLPADADFARGFLSGAPLPTQRSPSMDVLPSFRRPMAFAPYRAPRNFVDTATLSRAPSAPVLPRHLLFQQMRQNSSVLELQHGRSLDPATINRALLHGSHGMFGGLPVQNPLPVAGLGAQQSPGLPSWLSPGGAAPLGVQEMDYMRLLGQLQQVGLDHALQKGVSGSLDHSGLLPGFPNFAPPLASSPLPPLAPGGDVHLQNPTFNGTSLDGMVASFLPDTTVRSLPCRLLSLGLLLVGGRHESSIA